MNFGLSDEQELLQATVRQFLDKECAVTRVRELLEDEGGFDAALWQGMTTLGLAGLGVAEEYGGSGLEILDVALVAETLGHGAAPGPFLGHALASLSIALGGSEAQRSRWLPALAQGEALGTVALAEPGGGWQPEEWALAAGKEITGRKHSVPYASHADLLVVGVAGGGLVIVEPNASRVAASAMEAADRTRRLGEVEFRGARCEPLASAGPDVAQRVRDAGLVLLAADAFGGATRLIEMAVEYAKTRRQFGVPIAQFQAVKHRLVDMATDLEPARGLYWFAAHAVDRLPADAPRAAALAKSHLTDRFMQIARDAVEIHGGIGYTWECDVQIWFRRALFDRAFLGTPAAHRERSAKLAEW